MGAGAFVVVATTPFEEAPSVETRFADAPFALEPFVGFFLRPAAGPVCAFERLASLVAGAGFVGGDRSTTPASGAVRFEATRAGRAAGLLSAGRSARVRGATIVRAV
jgi:hypothetical protein